jgi:hypothetical protein
MEKKNDQEILTEMYSKMIIKEGDMDSHLGISSGGYQQEARPHVDDTNVTHQYSDKELHQMAIVALKDTLEGTNISSKPKIEWLISLLQKRAR